MSGSQLIPQPIDELENCYMRFLLFNECAGLDLTGLERVMEGLFTLDTLEEIGVDMIRLSHEFTLELYPQMLVNIRHWRDIATQKEQFTRIDQLENLTEHLKKVSEQVMEILDSQDFMELVDASKSD